MNTVSPVSFAASVQRLPQKGMPLRIEADEKQRAALAAEHGLLSVERFVADLIVRPWKGEGVRVLGTVEGDITQACVVTLEPVAAVVREQVDAVFLPEGSKLARPRNALEGEILLDPEGPDAPELFSGDTIDVGALAEEFFALGVDPYPRAPTASTEPVQTAEDGGDASPFAKLLLLKGKT